MDRVEEPTTRTGLWIVLLLTLYAWAPATYPGYWQSLEGFVPVFNAAYPSPIASIATAADVWRGAGSATFLLARPLILFGLAPVAAVRVVFAISFVLGALGIYTWLRPWLGVRAATLAGVLYALMPPFLATVYVKGDLNAALVLALLPLALSGLTSYVHSRAPSAAGVAVIALLWMWRTQAGLALLATLLLLAYVVWVERDRLALLIVVVSGGAGLLSLLPLRQFQAPAPVDFFQHFVYAYQWFGNNWSMAPSVSGWQDEYPFQLGLATVAFTLVSAWLWLMGRQHRTEAGDGGLGIGTFPDVPPSGPLVSRLLGFSFVAVIVVLFLCLEASAPLWRVTGAHRLLTVPWQVSLVVLPFLAVTAGSLPVLAANLRRIPFWSVLLVLAVLGSHPYLSAQFTRIQPPDLPVAVFGFGNDVVLLEATVTEYSGSEMDSGQDGAFPANGNGRSAAIGGNEARLNVMWQPLQPLAFDYNVFFQALELNPDGDGYAVVAQLDVQPQGGARPATTWQVGEILTDTYRLALPVDPVQVPLRYYFGYYDWRDGTRLPVDGGIEDKVVLYGQ